MAIKSSVEELRSLIHAFVRNFGLLDQTRTPCGMAISVSDAHALMELLREPGIEQTRLSSVMGLSKSATSRLIQRLHRRGQIKKVRSKADGRVYNLWLTEKGKRQAVMVNARSLSTFGAIIADLPNDATEHLLEYLPLLVEALPKARTANSD